MSRTRASWLAALAVWFAAAPLFAADGPVRKPFGIDKRAPWTTSKVVGSPDPPSPYKLEVVFPKLSFSQPLELTSTPGAGRLFVAERLGKIFSFPTRNDVAQADLLIDLGKTVYGLALHPKFQENGYFYVTYILDPEKTEPKGTRVSRFKAAGNPPRADKASEQLLIEWPSGGHNGGCLQFGPDGMLYIVTGDGSGIADELQTGQDLSDLLAALLRIDVDHHDAGRAYAIPKDNPFVNTPGARGEIWAYGLRQLWKFHFDRPTGDLWGGEVGQDLWEMVYRIQKGGNYGWSVQEGAHPFRPERKLGPSPILKPIIEQPHSQFRSITGGNVYRGSRLKELQGQYIYGDYDTGRVWAFRYQDGKVSQHRELTDTPHRIIDFGEDDAGELYALEFMQGHLYRLAPAPPAATNTAFPRKLSETGLFASTKDHRVAPGVIPYSVNAALWSDGAYKERFLALPGNSQMEFDTVTYPQPAPGAPPGWRFPDGTVLVKTFAIELEPGNPKSLRRLETRLLQVENVLGDELVGTQYWHGYTYIWNAEQTDAVLADVAGADETISIRDPQAAGGKRELKWHYPSRTECTLCHTVSGKYALGVNTMQLNKDHDYGGVVANQLATFEHLGLFANKLTAPPEKLPKLADYGDAKAPLHDRAMAYFMSNCSHCHRKWGGGNAEFQLLSTLPVAEMGIVNVRPNHGAFGLKDPKLLVPGDPERTMILHRMQKTGLGRMPHIASNVVDEQAVKLIREWIMQLPKQAASGE